ncbi:hypothetical protein GCM10010330_10900 [Streptomyces tendae]|uniref:hypothetical protein n=1 Tax=Streptomyces tendae TaxID=1932 RepID=UPI00167A3F43|nr:hypothetical protein [Streptomyces tendae]GHA60951.1 hypothetical protein GCM10010330_10900 [Streptomyces tendae]
MTSIPQATTTSPALPEQCIVASLTAEVMADADDGQLTLLASTLGNAADLQVISPRALLQMVNRQRAQLDQIEALAQEYAEKVLLPPFLDEYGIELEELDPASLFQSNPKLAAGFHAFAAVHKDGRTLAVVPTGQKPTARLAALVALIDHMQDQK